MGLGYSNYVAGTSSIGVGVSNSVSGSNSVAFGINLNNTIDNSVKIGTSDAASITILGDGSVGIGTTATHNYALAVNGTIGTKKVKVTTTGWPDYVFDKTYTLPSLQSVETYIAQNKHLPDVPSAATVAKDGLDLGDNQAVLLKKIEELTLYMIEMQKKNEQLQKQIDELKIKK